MAIDVFVEGLHEKGQVAVTQGLVCWITQEEPVEQMVAQTTELACVLPWMGRDGLVLIHFVARFVRRLFVERLFISNARLIPFGLFGLFDFPTTCCCVISFFFIIFLFVILFDGVQETQNLQDANSTGTNRLKSNTIQNSQ